MSNWQNYDGLRAYRAIEPVFVIAQRARKKKRVRALNARARNRRLDGLRKLPTQLMDENNRVVVGNVSSQALARTRMAKFVHDAGWGLLRGKLRH